MGTKIIYLLHGEKAWVGSHFLCISSKLVQLQVYLCKPSKHAAIPIILQPVMKGECMDANAITQ